MTITVYSKPACVQCTATTRALDRHGLDYTIVDVSADADAPMPSAQKPYVLVVPTYGGGAVEGAVPKPVIRFLNDAGNRALIRGVIAAGNTNFGTAYALAGDIVASKCRVPFLYHFELLGTAEDVANVRQGLERFWTR